MAVGQRKGIEKQIEKLPQQYSSDEILEMYKLLIEDMAVLKKTGMTQVSMEKKLHDDHKGIAYGLPSLFFRIVRGELNYTMFKTIMDIKKRVDSGEISNEAAKNLVVDGAKAQIEKNPNRAKKPSPEGSTVKEITMKCIPDDD